MVPKEKQDRQIICSSNSKEPQQHKVVLLYTRIGKLKEIKENANLDGGRRVCN